VQARFVVGKPYIETPEHVDAANAPEVEGLLRLLKNEEDSWPRQFMHVDVEVCPQGCKMPHKHILPFSVTQKLSHTYTCA
jgi:hypothetical protein